MAFRLSIAQGSDKLKGRGRPWGPSQAACRQSAQEALKSSYQNATAWG